MTCILLRRSLGTGGDGLIRPREPFSGACLLRLIFPFVSGLPSHQCETPIPCRWHLRCVFSKKPGTTTPAPNVRGEGRERGGDKQGENVARDTWGFGCTGFRYCIHKKNLRAKGSIPRAREQVGCKILRKTWYFTRGAGRWSA